MEPATHRERLSRLNQSLRRRLDDESIEVSPFREGVDCFVDRLTRHGKPPAVVRSAKVERLQTRYEGLVDFGTVLLREIVVARLLGEAGVPVPRVLEWYRTDDPERESSWVLWELIEHSPAEALDATGQFQLGRIAGKIHRIRPLEADGRILSSPEPWSDWIVSRILQRIDAARQYIALPDTRLVERALRTAIGNRAADARALLHLDLRPPNLAVVNEQIVAVFDYGNARCGDPFLELARLRECGLLTTHFLEGYGLDRTEVDAHEPLLRAYGLDLTALLVVVTKEELGDAALHAEMAHRTRATLTHMIETGTE